ncbi:MAG: hypothetical protein J6Z16_05150 [Candidatus Methanomethylophilaceae archaeon]|nr:hypothetical protein [Candidatus Methanomethylophilaceae archaeon]
MSSKNIGIILAVIVAIAIIAAAVFLMSGNNDNKTEYTVTLDLDGGESPSVSTSAGWTYDSEAKTWSKKFGSGAELPIIENPTKADSGNVRYKFSAWNPGLPSVVNESKTYTAIYTTEYYAKILVEDQYGVYFWTEGVGETIADVIANPGPGADFEMTDATWGKFVNEINGLASTDDFSGYWSLYSYKDDAWTVSELGVSEMKTSENPVVGFFYVIAETEAPYGVIAGGPDKVTVPPVSDAKVWDGKTDGTTFCIQSASGLFLYISDATGTTMAERFKAATAAYNVPFEESKRGGISTLFGIGSVPKTDSEGNPVVDPDTEAPIYNYWAQFGMFYRVWDYMSTSLANTNANDFAQMAIVYGDGGMGSASGLTAPVYYDGKNLRTDTAMILVEDQNGVYFWTEGSGETIADCIDDASAGVTFTMTDVAWGKFVNEINGLASTDDFSGYWSLYILENGEWVSSDLGVSSLTTEDNPVVGFFYVEAETEEPYGIVAGGPDNVIVPSISSAKVWDGKTDGTIFGIQGESGLYFYINDATGEKMSERFKAATAAYSIPYEESAYGISSIFGIGTTKKTDEEGKDVYSYWAQYGLKDGAWAYMDTTLPNTNANDFAQMAIVYGDGGMGETVDITIPIYVSN